MKNTFFLTLTASCLLFSPLQAQGTNNELIAENQVAGLYETSNQSHSLVSSPGSSPSKTSVLTDDDTHRNPLSTRTVSEKTGQGGLYLSPEVFYTFLQFTISGTSFENAYGQLIDTDGNVLLQKAIYSDTTTFSLSKIPAGSYTLRVVLEKEEISKNIELTFHP